MPARPPAPDMTATTPERTGSSLLLSYRTMQELVAEALRRQILSGELPPGAHLQQERIAQSLGVSRQPVREALRQLEVEGYLTIEPHRRVTVRKLSREDVEELFVLRSAIEAFAAEVAVTRMTATDLARMRAHLRRMEALQKADAPGDAFLEADTEFHHTLYEAAGRHGLLQRIIGLEQNSHRYIRAYFETAGSRATAVLTHRPILRAVATRDRPALRSAVISHLQSTVSGVLAGLDLETAQRPE